MTKDKIKQAEEKTNINPTENQKKAGNYKKGKITIKGLKITIENPAGSTRSGVDKDGNPWSNELPFTYGYFNSTIGKDGDAIDVYLGPCIYDEFDIYVVDQVDEDTKAFDEHKVMFGFESKEQAKQAYLDCYSEGWRGLGKVNRFSLSKFKKWIKNKDAIKYPASKLNMTSKIDFKNQVDEENYGIIRLFGEVKEGETLLNLKEQAGDTSNIEKLVMEIASPGGSVSEGLEIMAWLNELSEQGVLIITVVTANAYSIASLIMLAADMKLISKHGKVMVHNPMLPELQYVNANDLEEHITSLRALEEMMYELYELFTGLDRESIKILMDNETYLLPKQAVEKGFADTVVDIKPKSYEMATNIKREINMSKTLNMLNKVIGMVNQADFVNQLYYSEEGEIEIFQNDPATYSKGDRTSLEEGEVKLSDGAKLTIEDFVITDIDRSVEPELDENGNPIIKNADEPKLDENGNPIKEDEPKLDENGNPISADFNEGPAPKKEEDITKKAKDDMPGKVIETIESTKSTKETVATSITQINKWESEVINDSFELGTQVEYEPYEEGGEPRKVGAGEWELEDGSKVLTDADGIIRFIKPAEVPEAKEVVVPKETLEPKAKEEVVVPKETLDPKAKGDNEDFQAKLDEAVSKIEEKIEAKYEAKIEALEKKIEDKAEATSNKFEKIDNLQAVTAEAIDVLASNTVSGFKPSAKVVAEQSPRGSIFAQMKAKAIAAKQA